MPPAGAPPAAAAAAENTFALEVATSQPLSAEDLCGPALGPQECRLLGQTAASRTAELLHVTQWDILSGWAAHHLSRKEGGGGGQVGGWGGGGISSRVSPAKTNQRSPKTAVGCDGRSLKKGTQGLTTVRIRKVSANNSLRHNKGCFFFFKCISKCFCISAWISRKPSEIIESKRL